MTAQMTAQMTAPTLPLVFADDEPTTAGPELLPTGTAAHARMAERLLDRPAPIAPWNRGEAVRPARDRARHLRLVSDGPAPVAAPAAVAAVAPVRRGRFRTVLAGLGLAGLVALASVGALAFLGADAAASTPASPTSATPSDAAPVAAPTAVAESASPRWVVVQSGDSLWTLARRLQPKGDLRRLVDRLAERVGGTTITAGQRIDVSGIVD